MELDDLKNIWKESNRIELAYEKQHTPDEVLLLMRKRTQGALAKINQSIFFEVFLTVFLYIPLTLYYCFVQYNQVMAITCSVSVIVVTVHYYIKFKILNQKKSDSLNQLVRRLVRVMQKYLKVYYALFIISLIILDITFSYGFIATLTNDFNNLALSFGKISFALFVLLIILVLSNWLLYFLCKKYTDALYFKYLDELQNCLEELEEQEI
jgi:hypothetical protein